MVMLLTQEHESASASASESSLVPNPRSFLGRTCRFKTPTLNSNVAPMATTTPFPTAPRSVMRKTSRLKTSASTSAPIHVPKKSSRYRGVTKHRITTRFEAHLWDKDAYNIKQKKKGKQVYLGAYSDEISAAKAYDLAALKYWGHTTSLNFEVKNYTHQLKEMEEVSRSEFLAGLRRKSNGFSRGLSKFRGVARHHMNGRWEARIGRVEGNKYLYLGTFGTQEEAAEAYDRAAIKYRGEKAVTNFAVSCYSKEVEAVREATIDTSKSSLGETHISKTNEGRLQTIENVMQSLDGRGQTLSASKAMHPSLGTTRLGNHGMSKSLKDFYGPEQEKVWTHFPDSALVAIGETSGSNKTTLKHAKQEELFNDMVSQNDLNIDLGSDYNELLLGFNYESTTTMLPTGFLPKR